MYPSLVTQSFRGAFVPCFVVLEFSPGGRGGGSCLFNRLAELRLDLVGSRDHSDFQLCDGGIIGGHGSAGIGDEVKPLLTEHDVVPTKATQRGAEQSSQTGLQRSKEGF
jgi:hypothetical protein